MDWGRIQQVFEHLDSFYVRQRPTNMQVIERRRIKTKGVKEPNAYFLFFCLDLVSVICKIFQ